MNIAHKDVPELLKTFTTFFPKQYHINFTWKKIEAQVEVDKTAWITVIEVKVNDTGKGGEGVEYWLLEYANTIFKNAKEMERCAQRWLDGFASAKKKATLDILGQTVDSSTLN